MLHRRTVLAGLSASVLANPFPTPALAASTASRNSEVFRDGDSIGTHTMEAVLGANGFEIDITIRLAVKVLGITAYRYELTNREVWKNGAIVSVSSTVNDDGTDDFSRIKRDGDGLKIEGSRHNGAASLNSVTTSYYATPFLERRPWISTQTGVPLKVSVNPEGRANWWSVTGELETKLGYKDGEWVACEFDAGGELAEYKLVRQSGKIGALWAQA
ncbi:MAG: DUF6134 family protein [Pseudomonadota bacterium]